MGTASFMQHYPDDVIKNEWFRRGNNLTPHERYNIRKDDELNMCRLSQITKKYPHAAYSHVLFMFHEIQKITGPLSSWTYEIA
jgi:hypothetical protein